MQRQGAMQGFYWLMRGALAGCSRPGGPPRNNTSARVEQRNGHDAPTTLDDDLDWLRQRGITALLSLTETPLPPETLVRHNFATLHLPVDDLTAPAPEQLDRALAFIDRQITAGRGVAVHCLMGQGRTGTVLAAYRIRAGARPDEALREIRAICPGAVSSPEQERALEAFARRRDWIT